jgi:hypothetical protein
MIARVLVVAAASVLAAGCTSPAVTVTPDDYQDFIETDAAIMAEDPVVCEAFAADGEAFAAAYVDQLAANLPTEAVPVPWDRSLVMAFNAFAAVCG